MTPIYILAVTIFLLTSKTGAAECQNGWTAYKDELCLKTFPNYVTYEEAKNICVSQGDETSKASLVAVKDEEMQRILVELTADFFDNLWLGGRYDEDISEFRWDDGEGLSYTNWLEGSPRNDSTSDICIELRTINAIHSADTPGKWADVNCQKRNLVMCQKILSWSLQDAIVEIQKLRKRVETSEHNLEVVSLRVVPVGSVYIEYFGQPSPQELWPRLAWEDISDTYGGLFFRVSGGGAADWGAIQAECAPRITQMSHREQTGTAFPNLVNIPAQGWSDYGFAGFHHSSQGNTLYYQGLRFNTEGCEVRPRNQAIRVWRRTA